MARVSEVTMRAAARELAETVMEIGPEGWESLMANPESSNSLEIVKLLLGVFRLPIEVENRKRLISEGGLAAAAAQIDDDLPDDFRWPEEDVTTDRVFAAALLAAFGATEARPIE